MVGKVIDTGQSQFAFFELMPLWGDAILGYFVPFTALPGILSGTIRFPHRERATLHFVWYQSIVLDYG